MTLGRFPTLWRDDPRTFGDPPHARGCPRGCRGAARCRAGAAITGYTQDGIGCLGLRGSGQSDAAGSNYVGCNSEPAVGGGPSLRVYGADGTLQRTQAITFGDGTSPYLGDVAPSPDGQYV